ncbi:MAG: class III aminotransferase [Candidatus Gottesmanbacteria bacterium GW2011_GWA2_43_14]|uniref:Class III aminotransferase n=1 Tax=Candidatus Gottesmanbacteria bacterium GW2011_GWA2_43_14 TaxID=1618443 RepID=A0A0G1FSR7_9BACT|nr:MAG: class III aminotransferase [Candidatus Gottesmanbacteria bacterium GW2011_GWA2_43_14]
MKHKVKRQTDYLAHGDFVYRHFPVPVFVKAEGPSLIDEQGYKYFAAEAANGTTSLGFDRTLISEAVGKSHKTPSIPSFCETDIRKKVASRLGRKMREITSKEGKIAFELGGAQGMELALKIAKVNTKKSIFVVFEGGYHGRSVYTSQFSASHRYRSIMGDWRIPIVRLPYPDWEQSDSKNPNEYYEHCLNTVSRLTSSEVGGMITRNGEPDIAAFVLEPLLNAGGIVKPDKKYMEELVRIFKKQKALIVLDEVFCGFYRTGKMFGFQHYDFIPDIVVMSKAITNGITPLSCVWAKNPLLSDENFPPGTHSATFINNPLALSAADSVLDRFENWKTRDSDLEYLEKSFIKIFTEIKNSSKLVKSVFALGGVGRLLLKDNIAGKILDIARTVALKKPVDGYHGIILASTGMASNVVALNPPLNLSKKEISSMGKLLISTFEKADKMLL